ncbi:GspE family protein [Streptomyces albulus]|uniref:GspE family protein n=1 Tax=Streptomyces noursei TaxID=1971 RepID=UPI001F26FF83|nr:GspE family protein [Streptomyces noursei]MCE4942286.1 GspE family protein [Streptomyces noursei]
MIQYLNFLHTTVQFDLADDAVDVFAPIHRFFRHLMGDAPAQQPTFRIAVHGYDPSTDVDAEVWRLPLSVIRRSNAAEFNFDAHVVDRGGRRLYVNRATLLDAPVDARKDDTFHLRLTEGSVVQVLDFVRDLVIRREEDLGTVVLHASGAHRDGEAVIIAGPKGAGKTTTLLSVLRRPTWQYFTGDKLFCTLEDGRITVHPWRDYPYVGVGTIRADARLEALVRERVDPRLDAHEPGHKILMDPDVFESWLGSEFSAEPKRLAALLLPEVAPGQPLTTRHLTDDNERWAHLNKIVDRQLDTTFFTWQTHLVPDYTRFYQSLAALRTALDSIDMVRLHGTLDVDPDAVLDRTAHPAPSKETR